MTKIPEGKRPDTSMIADKAQVNFLEKCWSNDPNERPSFSDIVDILKDRAFFSLFDIDEDEVNRYISLFPDEEQIPKSYPPEYIQNLPTFHVAFFFGSREEGDMVRKFPFFQKSNKIDENIGIFHTDSTDFILRIFVNITTDDIHTFYLSAPGANVFAFDASIKQTFGDVHNWIENIYSLNNEFCIEPKLIYVIVINCTDEFAANVTEICEFAEQHHYQFFPISDEKSVRSMIDKIALDIANKFIIKPEPETNKKKQCSIY